MQTTTSCNKKEDPQPKTTAAQPNGSKEPAKPAEVFELLACLLPRCPSLRYVVLEQLGSSLHTEASRVQFRHDFGLMAALVQQHCRPPGPVAERFLPHYPPLPGLPVQDAKLHEQQRQLSHILETAASLPEAQQRLGASALAHSAWRIEHWEPYMLETAISIAQKCKHGSSG